MALKPRKSAKRAAKSASDKAEGLSPNPATNLLIADLALRGGGQLLRHAIERTVLGAKYAPDTAKKIVKGRSMVQTLVSTAAARIATRSVPGAIVVGGGLLAKTLYDRRQGKRAAKASGTKSVTAQAKRGDDESSDT
jgi:hypothetical protein